MVSAGAGQGGQLPLPVVTASGTNLSASTSTGVANFTTREMYTKLVDAAGLADDGSVLPVPSHVVLHHLGTSAIRNGVLAVADTMRYKKKVRLICYLFFIFWELCECEVLIVKAVSVMQYVTTIYYKPT